MTENVQLKMFYKLSIGVPDFLSVEGFKQISLSEPPFCLSTIDVIGVEHESHKTEFQKWFFFQSLRQKFERSQF